MKSFNYANLSAIFLTHVLLTCRATVNILSTLDAYSHVLPTMQQGATARLEKLLENSEAAQESDPTVIQAKSAS